MIKGGKLDSKCKNGQTPLSWAAKMGHRAVVMLLLEKGTEIVTADDGQTPLSLVAEEGTETVLKLTLEIDADLRAKDKSYDRTPRALKVASRIISSIEKPTPQ